MRSTLISVGLNTIVSRIRSSVARCDGYTILRGKRRREEKTMRGGEYLKELGTAWRLTNKPLHFEKQVKL